MKIAVLVGTSQISKDLIIDMISFLKKKITAHKVPAWTTISNAKPKSFEPNIKDGNKR